MSSVKPIPPGSHTLTPHLVVRDGARAIEFYKQAFGAEERGRMLTPDGKAIMHAQLKIGDSVVMLADEVPQMRGWMSPAAYGGTTVCIHMWSEDVDRAYARATAAGATPVMAPMDMFWGDRYCRVVDPFGHAWSIATHVKDLSFEEMEQGGREFAAEMCAKASAAAAAG